MPASLNPAGQLRLLVAHYARVLPGCLLAAALGLATGSGGRAAEWQWSAEMRGVTSPETGGPPRAFLWIPPGCARVRGIVIGQHNMEEEPILEHPAFRAALGELGFAAVWVTPPFDLVFRFDRGAGEHLEALLRELAAASGYGELAAAPVVPLGHSAAASFPWNFAAWNPRRTLAVLSVSGQWPFWTDATMPPWGDRSIDGIPGLVTIGEYEWADERAATGLKQRAEHPKVPLTLLAEAGGGHFDVSDEKVSYLTLYLRKAAAHRLPPTEPAASALAASVALRLIDPTREGWLVDRWRAHELPRAPASPVAEYPEPEDAFWCFDEEHAVATERFRFDQRGKRVALLGYVQHGAVLPQAAGSHAQVTIPFQPLDDGITFKLRSTFIDRVPKGRPERWTGLAEGAAVAHPDTPELIAIDRICGPVAQRDRETFELRFYRMGLGNTKRSGEIWFAATHPGDEQFKRSVQQAVLRLPLRNLEGARQQITFEPIADQRAGTTQIRLNARSDAGAKVSFYVREGPAEIAGDVLTFTKLPPRAKFPVTVTVVAWQYGRSTEPKLQSAEPVLRTFHLLP